MVSDSSGRRAFHAWNGFHESFEKLVFNRLKTAEKKSSLNLTQTLRMAADCARCARQIADRSALE